MKDNDIELLTEEAEHLARTQVMLAEALTRAQQSLDQIDQDYMDAKRYMAQYRGEIDPHEMFQNELALQQIDYSGAFAVDVRNRLARLNESPYFGRIDFKELDENEAEAFYIGRFTFSHDHELVIYDWRAPVAGMFYDDEIGSAGYDAPDGRIDGELIRKRQFKISHGQMEYALETSDNIHDEVLQRELSSTSDEKMKSIITTIQKEQNQIIRNENTHTLVIQGVAGSGKTSIALHRIAFLLYRQKDRLTARNVTIISPNKVFGDYISTVLPELGEEPIYEISFTELAEVQLEKVIGFERGQSPVSADEAVQDQRTQYKATLSFVQEMDRFISRIPEIVITITDYSYDTFSVSAEWIKKRLDAYQNYPFMQRLALVADDIYERFVTDNIMEHELPRPKTILKHLKAMLRFKNTFALYRYFYEVQQKSDLFVMVNRQTLEWNDVFPFLYLHAAFIGLQESKIIRHLVIDEMQDYAPIQFAVINRIFHCPKTILGDFGQAINANHQHTLGDLMQLYGQADLVRLNTSYRSTYEIIEFARQILAVKELTAIKRHGPMPQMIAAKSGKDELAQIVQLIQIFISSSSHSLGIICKSDAAARQLFEQVSDITGIHLITPDSKTFDGGISITSVAMSKGLEFDEVILPDVDASAYHTSTDRNLLYVACTRAMHRLTLLYQGKPSPLLPSGNTAANLLSKQ